MTEKYERRALTSRIAGCLLGGAIGDALGYEIEFEEWDTIRFRFGENGIQKLYLYDDRAVFSDDTQMTLFTLEGIILGYCRAENKGTGAPLSVYIWQAYLSWLKTQGIEPVNNNDKFDSISSLLKEEAMNVRRAPGNTCLHALSSGEMGTIENPINDSKGCGGVMRTAPLGFFPFITNPVLEGAKAAAITHGHPLGWLPAGILSGIVHRCIWGDTEKTALKEIIEKVIQETAGQFPEYAEYMNELEALLRRAIAMSAEQWNDVEAIETLGGGWTGDEALAIAVYSCVKYPDQLKKALICAANHSGDSDSTAAIAGNILGAYLGLDQIDMQWVNHLEMRDLIMDYSYQAAEICHRNAQS